MLPIAGAILTIIALGLGVSFAVQQGWFNHVSGGVRCLMAAIFGAVLLAVAEYLRRRVNDWAAVGLNSAGLGAMYVASFAAFRMYECYDATIASALLVAVTALGVFIGVRGRIVAVAIVAIGGGYLAPLLVGGSSERTWFLPLYWLMLLATGLILAGVRGGWFFLLRWLTGWATTIFSTIWIMLQWKEYPTLAFLLPGAVWAMVHAELWWSCAHHDDKAVTTKATTWRRWSPMLTSFGLTGWASLMGTIVAGLAGNLPQWVPPAAGVAATAILAQILVGHLRVLRDLPRTASERLGAALMLQTGALLIAAVALAASGWTQLLAWVGMSVAAVAAGRWASARPVIVYGLVLQVLAIARLILFEGPFGLAGASSVNIGGLELTGWSLLAALTAVGCITITWLLIRDWRQHIPEDTDDESPRSEEEWKEQRRKLESFGPLWRGIGITSLTVAVALLLMATSGGESLAVLTAWSGITLLLTWFSTAIRRLLRPLFWLATAVLMVGVIRVALWDRLDTGPLAEGVNLAGLRLTWWSLEAAVCSALAALLAWRGLWGARRNTSAAASSELSAAGLLSALSSLLLMYSVGADSPAGPSVLIAWGVFLVCVVWLSFRVPALSVVLRVLTVIMVAIMLVAIGLNILDRPDQPAIRVLGLALSAWTLSACVVAAACMLVIWAALRGSDTPRARIWKHAASILSIVCVVVLLLAAMDTRSAGTAVLVTWSVMALAATWLKRRVRSLPLDWIGLTIACVVIAGWVNTYLSDWDSLHDPLVLHRGMWLAFAIAASYWWISRQLLSSNTANPWSGAIDGPRLLAISSIVVPCAMVFGSTSYEVARIARQLLHDPAARGAAVSVWWGLFALALLAVGFRRQVPAARRTGLVLVGIAAAKALIFDTATVTTGWRALSVLGLGLMMLGVGVVYARLSRNHQEPHNVESDPASVTGEQAPDMHETP